MKFPLRPALATAAMAAPYALVMLAGWWWLWREGYFLWWALIAVAVLLVGRGLVHWAGRRAGAAAPSGVNAAPDWAPENQAAWRIVEEFSARVRREAPPLDTPDQVWNVLRQLLDEVARHYHPEAREPALETPAPHIARIVEQVAHDVGDVLTQCVPASHVLTVRQFRDLAAAAHGVYRRYWAYYQLSRIVRLFVSPASAVVREFAALMERDLTDSATLDLRGTVVDFAIRRTGRYAIELYSGHVMIDSKIVTRRSRSDTVAAATAEASAEPLRILIVGQVSAGKSSLVNAMFGDVRAATDVLPTTRGVRPLVFERPGFGRTLILDTAGYGGSSPGQSPSEADPFAALEDQLLACDLTILVSSATAAARASDRRMLDALAAEFQRRSKRRPPPSLVALTHIDLLRPFGQWDPPYDINEPTSEKARQIAAAVEAVATELRVEAEQVIPVCLAPERLYNVEEGLMPALVERLPEAARARALRCLGAAESEERWRLLWRQAIEAGRLVRSAVVGR